MQYKYFIQEKKIDTAVSYLILLTNPFSDEKVET